MIKQQITHKNYSCGLAARSLCMNSLFYNSQESIEEKFVHHHDGAC